MFQIRRKPLSRRHLLRGTGVALALPFLEVMLPHAMAAPSTFKPWDKSSFSKPRMICCYVPNGVNILDWVPPGSGPGYKLSPTLQVLAEHQTEFSVLSGLGHPASTGGHSGADTWLTASNLKGKPGSDYSNGLSIDQLVAQLHGAETRYPSIQLGDMSGTGAAGHSHTLSFDRTGTPLPSENSPQRLFTRLFVGESPRDQTAARKRYAERRSILDDIAADAGALKRRVGRNDQRKLDEFLTSVRQTETQVERLQSWGDKPKASVQNTGLQLQSQSGNAHDRPMWIDVMLELAYLVMITDTTRVITFQWSREASGFGGSGENHHELSHHGGDPTMLATLAAIDRFHLSRLGRFMSMLKSTSEADGNMLDRTVILYGSGMNSGKGGDHSPKNLPTLIAGGGKLGLKHGQHLAFDPDHHPPLSNLLVTIAQKMGVESDRFADATGTLAGLT